MADGLEEEKIDLSALCTWERKKRDGEEGKIFAYHMRRWGGASRNSKNGKPSLLCMRERKKKKKKRERARFTYTAAEKGNARRSEFQEKKEKDLTHRTPSGEKKGKEKGSYRSPREEGPRNIASKG